MTSTDRIIEGFAHPTITPIVGQPCYETIMPLKLSLSTNAASVNSHLGDGLLGLLWLTVTDAVFNTLSLIPFIPPLNPGPIPIIPAGATQFQITALTDTHKRETVIFQEFNNTDKALKQQLLGAVDDMFTRALKNRYIGYANVTTKQLLAHLFSTYGNITSGDLRQNDIKMNTAYDVNMPIETLFDQVEDGMEYAAAGNNPKTPEQIVMTGQQLITETGMFTDDIKMWKRLPNADKTWVRFKTDFSLAHQELRENAAAGSFSGQANSAARDTELSEAMANLATATAADRTTVSTLTATVSQLTADLAAINAHLVTALATNATLTSTIAQMGGRGRGSGRGRGGGRGRGAEGTTSSTTSRVGGPTGRFYCWSCGSFCYHSSPRCRSKKDGHKDVATEENKMNGSTHSFGG